MRPFTFLLICLVASTPLAAQWRAVQIAAPPREVLQIAQGELLVLMEDRYTANYYGQEYSASAAILQRVRMSGEVQTLMRRSQANGQYEPGTEAVRLSMAGSTVFVEVADITDVYSTPIVGRMELNADTLILSDTMSILWMCNSEEAYVARSLDDYQTLETGRYNFTSRQFDAETPNVSIEASHGLSTIIRDSTHGVWLVEGCDGPSSSLGDGSEYRGYSIDETGNIYRIPVGRNPPPGPNWSPDRGQSWHSFPERTGNMWLKPLADRQFIGVDGRNYPGPSIIVYYDSTSASWKDIVALPDSAFVIDIFGRSLSDVTMTVGYWPFEGGVRGYGIVKADLSTTVHDEGAEAPPVSDHWTVFDLQGKVVLSGTGKPQIDQIRSGFYLLHQGETITKIVR